MAFAPRRVLALGASGRLGRFGGPFGRAIADDGQPRRVLILGAGGQLGRAVGDVCAGTAWVTFGADSHAESVGAATRLALPQGGPAEQSQGLRAALSQALGPAKLDAVVNVAGGFAMGDAADPEVCERARQMIESSVYTSIVAAQVASEALKPGGLLVLPGAAAAFSPTAWSLPYGTAKAAVHHLVRSLADAGAAGLPAGVRTIGLAPQILDTPQNRAGMPDADRSTWATLDEVAAQLERWCADPEAVESGMVYVIEKSGGGPATFEPRAPL